VDQFKIDPNKFNPRKLIVVVITAVMLVIVAAFGCGNILEPLDADEQMVVQSPGGRLITFTTPGWKPQWFGRVTKYRKRENFDFTSPIRNGGKGLDKSIEVRFNDAGHAKISGTIAYEMPSDHATFIRMHSLYGSQEAVEQKLVAPAVTKAIYMTGPLMSSKESYADRRNELLSLIDDQIKHGVLRTRSFSKKAADAITGQEKTIAVVEIVRGSDGRVEREDVSPLSEFNIRTFNLAIDGVHYSPEVEAQIKEQQQMVMQVQTSMMEAKQAEQQRITTEQSGMAAAAKAKWEQEVIKATEVTSAEKDKAVAALAVQTAELNKRKLILDGEGEAEKKRLAMVANGALEQKIAAWIEVNKAYAKAIAEYQGNWVPTTVLGGGASQNNGAQNLVDILTAKTAKDLALDVSNKKQP